MLLELSGEGLAGEQGFGIHPDVLARVAGRIREFHEAGAQTSIVLGGGNVIREMSAAAEGMDRAQADDMGMLGSVITRTAPQDAFEREGIHLRSALGIARVAAPYVRRKSAGRRPVASRRSWA